MGTTTEPGALTLLEGLSGVPDYFMTTIARPELISEGILRFPCCLQDAGVLIPQVFLRVPVLRVAANARLAMQYTAELYNDQMMMSGRMMC